MCMHVQSDHYALDEKHFKKLEGFGMEVIPVDLNNAEVPFDKWGKDNLKNTQHSIRTRFDLGVHEDHDCDQDFS